ncbi:Pimeloyl-ACP methyl ester carboxylesterase [Albimonas donghaensis]|uniref:Pimeloyl-ACP methyl ester carboxylesterase n=1 Tax=Albimonas donghaensis TaxID=356660 RepID=A0A1H2Y9G5_9RHOB|nr:alpha/beta hydrolase [Albimonas donghaensis]SDX01189.1 Pimeloyl-ACP methyl ester carboxylesterase [Albimonas donghaensis]
MPSIQANGIEIFHDETGPAGGEPLLLISGVGMQMTRYSDAFCAALADRGFRVIRMDNRDIGLSQGFDAAGIPDFKALVAERMAGRTPSAPYTLVDMADDAAGLIEALGLGPTHVVGSSMGGMIVQLMAIHHADKLRSVTSIMSTTGHGDLPQATPEAMAVLTGPRIDPFEDREAYLAQSVVSAGVIGSPGWPEDEALIRARAVADVERAYRPAGFARQYGAILATPDRRAALGGVDLPFLVIHGTDDPLVRVEGGRDTAASVPGAEMLEIPGMGHNIPAGLIPRITDAIARIAGRIPA